LTTVIAASLLTLTTAGGLGFTYVLEQRQAGQARAALALKEATLLRDQAVAYPDDATRWPAAVEGVKRAETLLSESSDPAAQQQLAALGEQVRAGAKAAEGDRVLLAKLVDIRSAKAEDPGGSATDSAYAAAFRAAGLDLAALNPKEAGAKIQARPPAVALALAAALDDWNVVRHWSRKDRAGAERLAEAARVADPDPWRNDLRAALALLDSAKVKADLTALAETADFDDLGVVSLSLLGEALRNVGEVARAESVLRQAQQQHPSDLWLNYDLATVLEQLNRRDEAIRFYMAARAVRPETAHRLAHALENKGEADEAIAVYRDLTRLRPSEGRHLGCLGLVLKIRGRTEEAAIALAQAVTAHREAIRLQPDDAWGHYYLSNALMTMGKIDEAVAALREALRLDPNHTGALVNLGMALEDQGKLVEGIAAYRKAIRLRPGFATAHINLGKALRAQGKFDEALAAHREAIRLQPDFADAHFELGNDLVTRGKNDEAVAAHREAIRLKPDYFEAHGNLGFVLKNQGKLEEAVAAFRQAAKAPPGSPMAQTLPGLIRQLEQEIALSARLPGILKGDDQPRDNTERLAFSLMCYHAKHFDVAARLWAAALQIDPGLGDDRQAQHRYNAACVAALAAAGKGKDEPDDTAKLKLRGQAHAWLQAELVAWSKLRESQPNSRPLVLLTMQHWQKDPELAAIRDPEYLAKLPEDERKAWQALWADVEALLNRAKAD